MARLSAHLFWLALAAFSAFVIVRVADDYLNTIRSLQDFRWRAAQFQPPATDATRAPITLEVQNRSALDLDVLDLEVYLWLNDHTVGKTYARFERRTISSGDAARLPLVIEIDAAALRDAQAEAGGKLWRATGSYKVSTPRSANDFLFQLRLDLP